MFGWLPLLSVFSGITALVFGIVALVKRQPKAMAIIGIVLGVIAAISSSVAIVVWLNILHRIQDQPNQNDEPAYVTNGDDKAGLAKKLSVTDIRYAPDGTQIVEANVTNNSSKTRSVSFRITFKNASGDIISSAPGTVYDIAPGETKRFNATTSADVTGYARTEYDFVSIF